MHPIHPSFPPWCPYVHSLYLCLYFRFAFLKGHRLLIFLVDIFILKISIKKKRYLSYQLDKDCLQSVPLTSVIFQPLCFDFIIIFQKVNLIFWGEKWHFYHPDTAERHLLVWCTLFYPSLTNTSTDITITFSQIKKLRLKGMNEFSQGTQLLREKSKNQYQVFCIKAMMKERKAEQKEKEGRKWGMERRKKERGKEDIVSCVVKSYRQK